jgi:hypothetical protein
MNRNPDNVFGAINILQGTLKEDQVNVDNGGGGVLSYEERRAIQTLISNSIGAKPRKAHFSQRRAAK